MARSRLADPGAGERAARVRLLAGMRALLRIADGRCRPTRCYSEPKDNEFQPPAVYSGP